LISVVVMLSLLLTAPAAAKGGQSVFQPGEPITLEQTVPINIVLIGYGEDQVDEQELLDELPASYSPVVRYPHFYGLPGRDMGLEYNFDYHVNFAGTGLTDRFFDYLESTGTPGEPTDFQLAYNDQENNVLEVEAPVLYIDAPSVEQWLARNLRADKTNGYTIVFINWYNRPDFQFHVYTKTDVADPDTGHNFGELNPSRNMIAWGGSSSRLWFYDLSAGPEAWTTNYDVDNPDLDGNGIEDYRMPPIWEYTPGGYRDPSALSMDLGLVTRFVGIDLLFTTSPLYDPMVTAPGLGGQRVVHINMMEDDPNSLGTDWIDMSYVNDQLRQFQPYYKWETNLVDTNPIDPEAQRALLIFSGVLMEDDCWTSFGDPFAELFCYFDINRDLYIPPYDENDYVIAVHAFNTTGDSLGDQFGLLGFADDNWTDGTQTYVFTFDAEEYREFGYGFSTTTVHEVGHHIGLSHPHDGYDSELDLDFGPADEFYFVWSGDESNTIMSYLDVTLEFGQFDQDNMYRWETAGYLNWASSLLGEIAAHPNAGKVKRYVNQATHHAMQSIRSFENWDYLSAVSHARQAFEQAAIAAEMLGIEFDPFAETLRVVPNLTAPHEGDPIRYPDN
jgi:hypothetical protein